MRDQLPHPLRRLRPIRLWIKHIVVRVVVLPVLVAQHVERLHKQSSLRQHTMPVPGRRLDALLWWQQQPLPRHALMGCQ